MKTPKIIQDLDFHIQDKCYLPTAPRLDADAVNFETEWRRGVGSDMACCVTLTAQLAVKTVVLDDQTLHELGGFSTMRQPLRQGILHSIYGDIVEELLMMRRLAYETGSRFGDHTLFERITKMIAVLRGEE